VQITPSRRAQDRQRLVVVAGINGHMFRLSRDDFGNLGDVSARFLKPSTCLILHSSMARFAEMFLPVRVGTL
jgi:hypothetical protein